MVCVDMSQSPDTIVDSRLHVKHDLSSADARNARFFGDRSNAAHFASQLLVYERIVVPTNDFGVAPALIRWLGTSGFESALECGAIAFIHRTSLLGYAGNGAGINGFTIKPPTGTPFRAWWQQALFGEMSDAIELQLLHGVPTLTKEQRDRLVQQIVPRTRVASFSNEFFMKNIVNETYGDVRDTPEIAARIVELLHAAGATDTRIDLVHPGFGWLG